MIMTHTASYLHVLVGNWIKPRLAPNMLKNLPIIPSRTSQIFHLLFLFYSQAPTIIPFLFYCVNDNIAM